MDITLERILSLIPKKEDGKFVHGAKKKFCDKIGAPPNIVNEWERGANKSYRNYLYQISFAYGVSVEWLKGKTDIKEKSPASEEAGLSEKKKRLIDSIMGMTDEQIDLFQALVDQVKGNK